MGKKRKWVGYCAAIIATAPSRSRKVERVLIVADTSNNVEVTMRIDSVPDTLEALDALAKATRCSVVEFHQQVPLRDFREAWGGEKKTLTGSKMDPIVGWLGREVAELLIEEKKDIYHNASLLGVNVGCASDEEAYAFMDALRGCEYASSFIKYLQNQIEQSFGIVMELAQHGRSGATIAPVNIEEVTRIQSPYYNLAPDFDGIEGYLHDCETLEVLSFINVQVAEGIDRLPAWWAEKRKEYGYVGRVVRDDPQNGTQIVTYDLELYPDWHHVTKENHQGVMGEL